MGDLNRAATADDILVSGHGRRLGIAGDGQSGNPSVLLLDDSRVIHESTPIQPVAEGGHRDTLVVTLRAGNFQGEPAR